MKNISSVRQSRSRLFFIGMVLVVLAVLMAACSASGEQGATVSPTREAPTIAATVAPTIAATVVPTEVAVEQTAEPTEEVGPVPTGLPEEESVLIPQMGTLPMVDEVSFEVLAQYGGVAAAVVVADDVAYVGFGPRLLLVDVSDGATPSLLGQSEPLADNIKSIAVEGGLVYVAAGRAGLVVVDVAEAANPQVVSAGPNYNGENRPYARTVQIDGDTAFVTDNDPMSSEVSLLTFDISDPANVQFGEAIPMQINDNLVVDQGRLVIVGNGRIETRDTADLTTVLGESVLTSGDYASQVFIQGDTAIVVETGIEAGVEFFDISDLASPTALNDLTPIELFLGTRIAANETTLFSLGTFGEFGFCDSQIDVIDITSLTPEKISQLQPNSCVMDFVLAGNYLYTAGRDGLKIFDVSDPAAGEALSLFRNPNGFHSAEAVAVQGEVTYILTGEGDGAEVRLMDLAGETAVPYAESLVVGSTVLVDLFVQDGTLIGPQWQGGLYLYDLAEATAPELLHSPEDGSLAMGDIFSMALNGTAAYVPHVDGTLIGAIAAVDLSDPNSPEIASTVETGDYQIMHMVSGNGYLYVLAQGEAFNIRIFDIADPLAPVAVGTVAMPESTNRLALVGDTLFAACDKWNCQSLYAVDVSEADAPEIIGRWALSFGAQDLVPAGDDLFYLSTFGDGVWLLNVSDPTSPYLAGHLQMPGDYARLKVVDGVLYGAAFEGGLYRVGVR